MSGNRPQSIHTSDIFFTSATRPRSPVPPVPPHPGPRHAPTHTQSLPPPLPPIPPNLLIPQMTTTASVLPPPIPPKPSLRPYSTFSASYVSPSTSAQTNFTSNNTAFNRTSLTVVPPRPQSNTPSPDRSEDGLALAMELSQSDARNEQKIRDKISTQEEEDLARALKESLISSGPSFSAGAETSFASSSAWKARNSFLILEGEEISPTVESANSSQVAQDEALALRLAMDEANAANTPKNSVTSSPPAVRATIVPDHTLSETPSCPTFTPSSPHTTAPATVSKLPTYLDVVRPSAEPGSSSTSPSTPEFRIGRPQSASPHLPQNAESSTHSGDGSSTHSHSLDRLPSRISLVDGEDSVSEANPPPNPTIVNVNHFVDKKLFKGVCEYTCFR
jgi:hypothetical protein